MAKGILVAALHMADAAADEFNDWYDTEHMPERRRCPGFLTAMRWAGASDPGISIGIYDLETIGILQSPGYLALRGDNLSPWSRRLGRRYKRVLRFEGSQITSGDPLSAEHEDGLALIVDNDSAGTDEEQKRLSENFVSALRSVEGVINARRFAADNDRRKVLTICQLTSPDVVDTPAWKRAMDDGAGSHATREMTLTGARYRQARI